MSDRSSSRIRPEVAREIESILSTDDGDDEAEEEEESYEDFTLEDLDTPLNETEMVAIADAISQSTTVAEIILSGSINNESPTAATFISKIFETHPSVRQIDLGVSDDLAEVIGLALKRNTSLKVLYLYANDIGPVGAVEALAEGLRHNQTLQELILWGNQVGDRGATALADALPNNKTLEKLDLGTNQLTAYGAKALASALEKASLKELILKGNNFQDEGGKALAESLYKNKSLTGLNLECTGVGDDTCMALASALCNNSSLKLLDLRGNNRITNVGAIAMEDTLKHLNFSVENINFEDIHLNFRAGVPMRIHTLCNKNIRVKAFFQRVNQNIPAIPLGVWPTVLEAVECKPDLLFALLKTKPEVCRELQHSNQRRRKRSDWLRL